MIDPTTNRIAAIKWLVEATEKELGTRMPLLTAKNAIEALIERARSEAPTNLIKKILRAPTQTVELTSFTEGEMQMLRSLIRQFNEHNCTQLMSGTEFDVTIHERAKLSDPWVENH